jgi:hypothetical protein
VEVSSNYFNLLSKKKNSDKSINKQTNKQINGRMEEWAKSIHRYFTKEL